MITTLVNPISAGMNPRQTGQAMQFRANERTADEIKTEDLQQVDSVSISTISTGNSSMDVRMFHIHQAADVGILRPVWMDAVDVTKNRDMPRMRDLINRVGENMDGNAEQTAADAERTAVTERAAATERIDNAERAADL